MLPALRHEGRKAPVAFGTAWALAVLLYVVGHARQAGRLRESMTPGKRSLWLRPVLAGAAALAARHPVSRAGFSFTLQTLARSGKHRLYLAGYLALGVALAAVVASSAAATSTAAHPNLAPGLMALQMTLVFALVAGLRSVVEIPAELRSNWVFRTCWNGDIRRYVMGVRRAFVLGIVTPLLALLMPLHVFWWGWGLALRHAAIDLLAALVLLEAALVGFRKLPFTCSYLPKGTFKFLWPAYLVAFFASTYLLATIERPALAGDEALLRLAAGLVLAVAALRLYARWRLVKKPEVVFEEAADPAAVALGL